MYERDWSDTAATMITVIIVVLVARYCIEMEYMKYIILHKVAYGDFLTSSVINPPVMPGKNKKE